MTSMICPHCKAHSSFTTRWNSNSWAEGWNSQGFDAAIQCENASCHRTLGAVVKYGDTASVLDYWPKLVGGKNFPDVPELIAATANEAHECASIGAFRGAAALARAVVESLAKEKGISKGMLNKKIEQLEKDGVITRDMREAADEIRFAGNEVAHGDLVDEPIDSEDAEEILDLMDSILAHVYQQPNKVRRVRERRELRRPPVVDG